MGMQNTFVTADELADIAHQCAALHEDWRRFYLLAAAPPAEDPNACHLAFIQLRSRLSCDYPILSHWQKGALGLSSKIGALVSQADTLESLAQEVHAGGGPLLEEWRSVNDAIERVRALLAKAMAEAKKGKPAKLPREIAPKKVREPLPLGPLLQNLRVACIILVGCAVAFVVLKPLFIDTSLFAWLDDAFKSYQIRKGLPGIHH